MGSFGENLRELFMSGAFRNPGDFSSVLGGAAIAQARMDERARRDLAEDIFAIGYFGGDVQEIQRERSPFGRLLQKVGVLGAPAPRAAAPRERFRAELGRLEKEKVVTGRQEKEEAREFRKFQRGLMESGEERAKADQLMQEEAYQYGKSQRALHELANKMSVASAIIASDPNIFQLRSDITILQDSIRRGVDPITGIELSSLFTDANQLLKVKYAMGEELQKKLSEYAAIISSAHRRAGLTGYVQEPGVGGLTQFGPFGISGIPFGSKEYQEALERVRRGPGKTFMEQVRELGKWQEQFLPTLEDTFDVPRKKK